MASRSSGGYARSHFDGVLAGNTVVVRHLIVVLKRITDLQPVNRQAFSVSRSIRQGYFFVPDCELHIGQVDTFTSGDLITGDGEGSISHGVAAGVGGDILRGNRDGAAGCFGNGICSACYLAVLHAAFYCNGLERHGTVYLDWAVVYCTGCRWGSSIGCIVDCGVCCCSRQFNSLRLRICPAGR